MAHQQWCATSKYQNIHWKDKQAYPNSQLCSYYIKRRNFIGKYYFPVGFQLKNIVSSVSKSIWNRLMRFKRQGVFKKLYSFNLIFNYRGKTIALMFFSMSFLFRAAQSRNRPSDIWIWTRDPSYQIPGK